MADETPFTRKVHTTAQRKYDVDIHTSEIVVDDAVYADVREFIPTLGQYGRGIIVPLDAIDTVIKGLQEVKARHAD